MLSLPERCHCLLWNSSFKKYNGFVLIFPKQNILSVLICFICNTRLHNLLRSDAINMKK